MVFLFCFVFLPWNNRDYKIITKVFHFYPKQQDALVALEMVLAWGARGCANTGQRDGRVQLQMDIFCLVFLQLKAPKQQLI